MKLNRNSKIFINYFLGPLLFAWLSWSIYRQIQKQPNLAIAWQEIKASFNTPLVWNLVAVIGLMVANWGIEAVKWRLSVRSIQRVSFSKAFRAVLSGVSFSVSTPNRIGEFLGRVLYMDEGNRLKTISITILGSISQLIITVLMGCIGLIVLFPAIGAGDLISPFWMKVLLGGFIVFLAGLVLFYFRLSWLVRWVDKIPVMKRFTYLIEALEDFSTALLLKLLLLSFLRFIVFIVQYWLVFYFFGVDISWWESVWSVSITFLVLAMIPSFAIADVGLRGEVSIRLIGLFAANKLGIIFSTVTIWFINLIVPAIIGSLLILGIRKMVEKKDEGKMIDKN